MPVIALQNNRDSDRADELARIRQQAFELVRDKSFIRRPIKLSSGKESTYYFDMKFTMLDPVGSGLLAELIFSRLPSTQIDYVGGLELGAVPLISPIAMLSAFRNRPIPGLIVRKTAKEHGTQRLVEGAENLQGKNVVVVDDVTTTGASAMKSIRALQADGANVLLVISILDREEGAEALYRDAGIPFDPLFRASEFLA
jgi:orotate phosphoribosyltransferase